MFGTTERYNLNKRWPWLSEEQFTCAEGVLQRTTFTFHRRQEAGKVAVPRVLSCFTTSKRNTLKLVTNYRPVVDKLVLSIMKLSRFVWFISKICTNCLPVINHGCISPFSRIYFPLKSQQNLNLDIMWLLSVLRVKICFASQLFCCSWIREKDLKYRQISEELLT